MVHLYESACIKRIVLLFILTLFTGKILFSQDYRYGIYATPLISWFRTDVKDVHNKGARAGFTFNISAERHLTDNWYFNSGLAFTTANARLVSINESLFRFPDKTSMVSAGDPVIYRLQYVSIPVGIKIRTSETGYFTYFAEFGLDPKMVINGRADIPSLNIEGGNAMNEIKRFNFGYHLTGGAEYSLDGISSLILGMGYERNTFDITKDYDAREIDRTFHNLFKFIFGINF
jgi:hypothetical protein